MASSKVSTYVAIVTVFIIYGILTLSRSFNLHEHMMPTTYRYICTTLQLTGIAFAFGFIPGMKHYISREENEEEQEEEEEEQQQDYDEEQRCRLYLEPNNLFVAITAYVANNSSILAVYVFGSGCLFINMLVLLSSSQCTLFWRELYYNQSSPHTDYYSDSGNDNKYYNYPYNVATTTNILSRVLFFITVIPFLQRLSKLRACKQQTKLKYCLVPVMATCFSVWLFAFVKESEIFSVDSTSYSDTPYTKSLRTACLNHSTVMNAYITSSLTNIFYPISMEFCMASMEIIYHVLFIDLVTSKAKGESELPGEIESICEGSNPVLQILNLTESTNCDECTEQDDPQADSEETPLIHPSSYCRHRRSYTNTANSSYVNEHSAHMYGDSVAQVEFQVPAIKLCNRPSPSILQKIWMLLISLNHCYVAILLGLIETVLLVVYIEHTGVFLEQYPACRNITLPDETSTCTDLYISRVYLNKYISIPLTLFRLMFSCIPSLLVAANCVHVMKSFRKLRQNPKPFKISLILGIVGNGIMSVYEIWVCIWHNTYHNSHYHKVPTDVYWNNAVLAIQTAFYLPQYILQTIVIFKGQRYIGDTSHPMYKTLRPCLMYLAIYNFVQWGQLSFLEKHYVHDRFSDSGVWQYMALLGIPAAIYFRFISVSLLLGVESLLHVDEIIVTKWKMFMHKAPSGLKHL